MNIPEVVRRYAVTLLDAAEETGALEDTRRDLEGIGTALAGSGELRDFLHCLLYTSPSPRDGLLSRMPSSA